MTHYLPLLHELDAWQDTARQGHPGIIPCGPGCSACCHGPFDISVADARLVAEAIAALPAKVRVPLVVRATAQLEQLRELAPGLDEPWDVSRLSEETFDALCEALAEDPCPALDTAGRCVIYEARPLVCRIMGLGLRNPEGGEIPNACPIQDEFPGYSTLPTQPFDLAAWETREAASLTDAAEAMRLTPAYETTVAGAIVLQATPLG
jgi:Fe-S-cluster containining protein